MSNFKLPSRRVKLSHCETAVPYAITRCTEYQQPICKDDDFIKHVNLFKLYTLFIVYNNHSATDYCRHILYTRMRRLTYCTDEGHDYRRYWRGDSGLTNCGGGNDLRFLGLLITKYGCTYNMQKHCNGKSRNERTKMSSHKFTKS